LAGKGEKKRMKRTYVTLPEVQKMYDATLRAPSPPPILVKLAYHTHPVVEKKLRRNKFQDEVARPSSAALRNSCPWWLERGRKYF